MCTYTDAVSPRQANVVHLAPTRQPPTQHGTQQTCDTSAFCMAHGAWPAAKVRPDGGHRTNRRAARARTKLNREQWGLALKVAWRCVPTVGFISSLSVRTLPATLSHTQRPHRTRTGTSTNNTIAHPSILRRPHLIWPVSRGQHWIDRPADSAFTLLGPRDKGQG